MNNRELKFRAWDNLKKEWLKRKVYHFNPHFNEEGIGEFRLSQHAEGFTIQQYTGLKDKNGKEIYEGDIVYGFCLNDGPQICVVGFDTWGIYYTKIKHYPCEEWENIAMLAQEHNEVIGNIMETPELIKNNDNNNQ
jgi:uncharacterized phage protein (TIGR01671 family)